MNKNIFRIVLGMALVFGLNFSVQADDFELWQEEKIFYLIPNSQFVFRWDNRNHFRSREGEFDYYDFYTTVGFDYRFKNKFTTGFQYRIRKKIGDPLENRPTLLAQYETALGPFKLVFQERFEFRIFTNGVFYFRSRTLGEASHVFNAGPVSFTPFVNNEVFIQSTGGLNEDRFSVGNYFGFWDDQFFFGLWYMLKRAKPINPPQEWVNSQIFGTSLVWRFGFKKQPTPFQPGQDT